MSVAPIGTAARPLTSGQRLIVSLEGEGLFSGLLDARVEEVDDESDLEVISIRITSPDRPTWDGIAVHLLVTHS